MLAWFGVLAGTSKIGSGAPPPESSPRDDRAMANRPWTSRVAVPIFCLAIMLACGSPLAPVKAPKPSEGLREALAPLNKPMPPTAPGDWLAANHEHGQTFEEYRASSPERALSPRRVLYVVQLGPMSEGQGEAFSAVADFLGIFYDLPVKHLDPIPESAVPADAVHESRRGSRQFQTGPLLEDLLPQRVPSNAAALLAFTATDLWPGPGWNYVFGQATWRQRVGVFSFCRLFQGPFGKERGLRRALAISAHEVGHLFGMRHCTKWLCLMNGCNSLSELDRHPLWLCPECLMKLTLATGADKESHCRRLEAFCKERGLSEEARFYGREAEVIAAWEHSR